jgi:hypothetical protein
MTTFLQKNGIGLALSAVVSPLASYGLQRMFPAPEARFIVIAYTLASCTLTIIYALGSEFASNLTSHYRYINAHTKTTNFIFHRLDGLFSCSIHLILPIFVRYVGQRMGIQVPGYLLTAAYFSLAGSAVAISKTITDIGFDLYYLTPATDIDPMEELEES